MDEHDDDLDSEVHENAEQETDTYPDTGDDLEPTGSGDGGEDEDLDLDDDEAEL
jgi:hypothetical protein